MSSEDEEQQIKKAIALSLQQDDLYGVLENYQPELTPKGSTAPLPVTMMGSKYDRKAMEAERLARVARKRKAALETPGASSETLQQTKKIKTEVKSPMPVPEIVGLDAVDSRKSSRSSSFTPGSFTKGALKRTWAFGHPRDSDIKIEELMQKDHVKIAVLSSYTWDMDWILRKFIPDTKMVLIYGLKDEQDQREWTKDVKENYPRLKLCFPKLVEVQGFTGLMHSKLMILNHHSHLRIAIPTGNLVSYDWGENGIMENSVFVIDLPRLDEPVVEERLTQFGRDMLQYFKAMEMDDVVCRGLLQFDWAATKKLAFVYTIAGANTGDHIDSLGYLGLSKAMRDLGLTSTKELLLDYATASMGALNDRMLAQIYTAAMGDAQASKSKQVSTEHLHKHFRIYFPSNDTVMSSKGKADNAGTICLQERYWKSSTFPRDCIFEYKSTRQGLLSHNKLLLGRGRQGDLPIAWAYVGSANFSESAWGNLVVDRRTKRPKMNCRNWECGVVFPIPQEGIAAIDCKGESGATIPFEVFETQFKIPFKYPAEEYGPKKQPWFFMNHQQS